MGDSIGLLRTTAPSLTIRTFYLANLTAFVEQFADGNEAIASDPPVPVTLRLLRRVTRRPIGNLVVVVVLGGSHLLPYEVGR